MDLLVARKVGSSSAFGIQTSSEVDGVHSLSLLLFVLFSLALMVLVV